MNKYNGQIFMRHAISQAKLAYEKGEVPIGAVIVYKNKVISEGHNVVQGCNNACMHAEIIAINKACEYINSKYLYECDIYSTLEPCCMCAAAISYAKLRKLVYGASDIKLGAVNSNIWFFNQDVCMHRPEVVEGIMREESEILLKDFFSRCRSGQRILCS